MRIDRIRVDKYGPLDGIELRLDPGFNCVHGPNESGKTLLVDAFLKMSLGKKQPKRLRDSLNRVRGKPKGFATIATNEGEHTIDELNLLTDLLSIPSEEIRDIFIIRNSDLSFLDEEKCLGEVSNRILNLGSEAISEIQRRIHELGRITEKANNLRAEGGEGSPSKQVEKAERLIDWIDNYLQDPSLEEVVSVEQQLIQLEIQREQLERKRDDIEIALKKERLRVMQSAVKKLESHLSLDESEIKETKSRIEDALDNFDSFPPILESVKQEGRVFAALSIFGAAGLMISVTLSLLQDEGIFGILQTLITAALTLYTSHGFVTRSRELSNAHGAAENLLSLAQRFEPRCETSKHAYDVLKVQLKEIESQLGDRGEQVGTLRTLLGVNESNPSVLLEQARENIRKLEADVGDTDVKSYDENDRDRVAEELKRTSENCDALRKTLETHRRKLQEFGTHLKEIRFLEYLGHALNMVPDSLESLQDVRSRLVEFVQRIKHDAEVARKASSIFDRLMEEEDEKVSQLLSKGSRASEIFAQITNGSYVDIKYLPDEKRLAVVDNTGKEFSPSDLSKATKDQLYLSIRVAVGERLLTGERGFFIMDDPFLASDLKRAETQYEILRGLVDDGWQILLFTAREDLAQVLSTKFGTKPILMSPLRST